MWMSVLLACQDPGVLREGKGEYDDHTPRPRDTASVDDTGEWDTGDSTPVDPNAPQEVCYPGADWSWTTCVAVVPHRNSWGDDYDYPDPYNNSDQYIAPARYIDLTVEDPDLVLAPNFVFDEFMQEYKGPYGIFQPHVVAILQDIRDEAGPVIVNSGYRNVGYNAGVGGATYSRHQYGDAVDIAGSDATLSELVALCEAHGADYVSEYTSHVHCDWRNAPLEPAFYDVESTANSATGPTPSAELVPVTSGWQVNVTGFDEGEPTRRWKAHDADGVLLAEGEGVHFVPPEQTAVLSVVVGHHLQRSISLP